MPTRPQLPKVQSSRVKTRKALICNDWHIPHQDVAALELLFRFCEWFEPDAIFLNGDIFDFYQVSKFDKNPERLDELQDNVELAVVDDARFPDEVAALRAKGKAVLLTRGAAGDKHASENSLPGPECFDLVIDNAEMTVDETNQALVMGLRSWGWWK